MIKPDTWLLAYAINPKAVMSIFGIMASFWGALILFVILASSVSFWLVSPFTASLYLLIASVIYSLLKFLIASRSKKLVAIGEGDRSTLAEIVLAIPMFISLAVATYLWIFGFISLIYSNFYVLLGFVVMAISLYFFWDFFRPWISSRLQKDPNPEDS